jgi:hypothetical protein
MTISGLVLEQLGRLPDIGDAVEVVRITVLAMEKRRIARLRVERLTGPETAARAMLREAEHGPAYTTRPAAVTMAGPLSSWMVAVLSTIGLLMGLYVAWRLFWPLRMPIG